MVVASLRRCSRGVPRALLFPLLFAFATCGTERFYEGAKLPSEQVAVIHVGDTIVLDVDGARRRGGYFGSPRIEVKPGRHTLTLVFEEPARSVGAKEMPAMSGEGTCTIELDAEAGKQYWLGAIAVGEDWTGQRWDGKWRAWIRDPSVGGEEDIVARCDSQPSQAEEGATPTIAAAPKVAEEKEPLAPAPLAAPALVAQEEPPATTVPSHPSAGFSGGLDPAVWIVRTQGDYRIVVRRLCSVANECWTETYLQTLAARRVPNDGREELVVEEKTTVPIEEANSASAFVEDVKSLGSQKPGAAGFELYISSREHPRAVKSRLLVLPAPDGSYVALKGMSGEQ